MKRLFTTWSYLLQDTYLFLRTHFARIGVRQGSILIAGSLFSVIALLVALNILWAVIMPIPAFGELQNKRAEESTKIYDRTGTVMLYDTAGGMRRTAISLSEVSPYLIAATIAIEDSSFYSHSGIRPTSIIRAMLSNVENASWKQGGSTLTQQVIKNTLLTSKKSVSRKIKEWILALRIEQKYSKDEILQTYFNETPYGGTIYGAEEASRSYFNKTASALTLSEAAYLAALPKAPTYFSPWGSHFGELQKRHGLVLEKMLEHGTISQAEYESAVGEEVAFEERNTATIKAPHFVFYVLEELEKEFGKEEVYEEGLQVITTLDWGLQQDNEKIILEGALRNERNFNASNAGLVAIDPRTGEILSMVGSRDYFDDSVDGQVNVTLAERQPGSAFKPFVYAAVLEKGYSPDTVLFDLKTQFSTACAPWDLSNVYPCYSPDNYDSKFRGPMTLRDALAQSVNVVAVKALYLSGIDDSITLARKFGITTLADADRYGLTLVLGGGEVKLLEMTSAYGAFANEGVLHTPTPLLSVHSSWGRSLYKPKKDPRQVIDREIALTINDMLSDNEARAPAFGSYSPLYFENTQVADKTGTTNDYRDAWVIGYTSGIVVGSWAGNNDNTPMAKSVSSYILAPMWHEAMEASIVRYPSAPFNKPENLAKASPADIWSMFSERGAHEILYWVDKDSPHSGTPENPYKDPQFAHWEYPVALWAGQQMPFYLAYLNNYGTGGPDGVPLQMFITSPGANEHLQANQPFTATVSHSEMNNVLRVSYYQNGEYIGSADAPPFTSPPIVAPNEGTSVILAVAESPLGNTTAVGTFTVGKGISSNR